jgi:cytochrome bd-type quinol oxidase subunit 2
VGDVLGSLLAIENSVAFFLGWTFNASSSPLTLTIMLIVVLLFVTLVLAYQLYAFKLFSSR